jgi:hypothetical protein
MLKLVRRYFSHPPRNSKRTARRRNDSKYYNYCPSYVHFKTNEDSHTIEKPMMPGESPQEYDVLFEGVPRVPEEITRPITEVMGDERLGEINARKHKRINFYVRNNKL